MPQPIAFDALTAPVSRAEVHAFRAAVRAGAHGTTESLDRGAIGRWIFVALAAFVAFVVAVPAIVSGFDGGFDGGGFVFVLPFVVVAVVAGLVGLLSGAGSWRRWCALARFAAANGWAMQAQVPGPEYPGMLFGLGNGRIASERILSTSGRAFDIANYQYTTGSGKNRTTHRWHYLGVRLDRSLPHMVLDATANDGLFGSTLPSTFSRDQVLSLEGDFDRHFTLYCPREYETDALYVFTPDLMALVIDESGAYDVEIVDDWIFFYSPRSFAPLDPAVWQRFLRLVDVVGAKAAGRAARYRDDRAVPPGTPPLAAFASTGGRIAPSGQRLRKGVNWMSVVIMVAVVAGWIWFAFR